MNKLVLAIALAFALAAGAATVMTVQLQPAIADCTGNNC
jgi:hypothetical protein